jgi:hypothetical protein
MAPAEHALVSAAADLSGRRDLRLQNTQRDNNNKTMAFPGPHGSTAFIVSDIGLSTVEYYDSWPQNLRFFRFIAE